MGRKVGDLVPPRGETIGEALGEYMLHFAEVEAALSLLFAFLKSMDPEDPGRWDPDAWERAEKEIDDCRLSAGQLAKRVNELVLPALDGESETQSTARDVWRELVKRGRPVIDDRNALVHRQLRAADEMDSTQTGLVLHNGDHLTEAVVRTRAESVWRLAVDLRNFYGTLVRAQVQSKVKP